MQTPCVSCQVSRSCQNHDIGQIRWLLACRRIRHSGLDGVTEVVEPDLAPALRSLLDIPPVLRGILAGQERL